MSGQNRSVPISDERELRPLLEEPSVGPTAKSKLHGAAGLAMPEWRFDHTGPARFMKVA